MNILGLSTHTQRFTPPYYLDVDNPFANKALGSFQSAFGVHFKVRQGSF